MWGKSCNRNWILKKGFFIILVGIIFLSTPALAVDPSPQIISIDYPTSISSDQTITVWITIKNNGGYSPEAYFSPSFSNDWQIVDYSGGAAVYPPGSNIWPKDGNQFPAQYTLIDWMSTWNAGETKSFWIKLKPKTTGNLWFNVRTAFLRTAGDYSIIFRDPNSNTGYTDQQGFYVYRKFISVSAPTQNPTLTNTYISPSSVNPGQSFTGYYTINNPNSNSMNLGLGLSIRSSGSNNAISDIPHDIIISAAPGTNTYSRTFTVPPSTSSGSYDVAQAIWSGQPGSSTQYTSSGWKPGALTISPPATPPDITVTSVSFSPSSAAVGQSISVTFTIKNQGGTASGSFYNRISLATSRWGTDYNLGYFPMSSLDAGASNTVTINANSIPSSIPAGSYYVTVYADAYNGVTESNENNNIGSSDPIRLTISSSQPQIVSINPAQTAAGTFDLTINGNNFDSGAVDQIYWKADGRYIGQGSILSRTGTQIAVREYMAGITPGVYVVKVKNSDGQLSNGMDLTVTSPPPQNPTLSRTSISPSTVLSGQSFTGYYTINNPNSNNMNVGLGLSIRRSGTYGEIVDTSNDLVISATPGINTYSRTFIVPSSAFAGSYDVAQAIWSGSPGTGIQYDTSGWKPATLTVSPLVQQSLAISVSPASKTINSGESASFSITVTDQNGNGVSGATVSIEDDAKGYSTSITTNSYGSSTYTTNPIASGYVYFTASKQGYTDSNRANAYITVNKLDSPAPSVSTDTSSFSIEKGQTKQITFNVQNNGGDSTAESYLSISVSDGLEITGYNSNSPEMGFSLYLPRSSIWSSSGSKISSGYQLLDAYKAYPAESSATVTITVKAKASGSQWIKYRTAFSDGNTYYRNPTSGDTDQQGWYAYTISGNVKELIQQSLSISVSPTSKTIDSGDSASFSITVTDQDGKGVGSTTIGIEDSAKGFSTSLTTDNYGQATYTTSPTLSGNIYFTASKFGYKSSSAASAYVTVNTQKATLYVFAPPKGETDIPTGVVGTGSLMQDYAEKLTKKLPDLIKSAAVTATVAYGCGLATAACLGGGEIIIIPCGIAVGCAAVGGYAIGELVKWSADECGPTIWKGANVYIISPDEKTQNEIKGKLSDCMVGATFVVVDVAAGGAGGRFGYKSESTRLSTIESENIAKAQNELETQILEKDLLRYDTIYDGAVSALKNKGVSILRIKELVDKGIDLKRHNEAIDLLKNWVGIRRIQDASDVAEILGDEIIKQKYPASQGYVVKYNVKILKSGNTRAELDTVVLNKEGKIIAFGQTKGPATENAFTKANEQITKNLDVIRGRYFDEIKAGDGSIINPSNININDIQEVFKIGPSDAPYAYDNKLPETSQEITEIYETFKMLSEVK